MSSGNELQEMEVGTKQSKTAVNANAAAGDALPKSCLLYTSPSPRDRTRSRMPSSA